MKKHLLVLCFLASTINAQTVDYAKAPNSYVFDLDLAKSNDFGGINIPVKKAYEMWGNYQYLKTNGVSAPIPPGVQTASIGWVFLLAGLIIITFCKKNKKNKYQKSL